jgi:hypothetical protein
MTLTLTTETWFRVLELAEEYGWRPVGTALLGVWDRPELSPAGSFLGRPLGVSPDHSFGERRLMVWEDALSLAEALERAFMTSEPVRLPVSYFLFGSKAIEQHLPPSVGALLGVIDICRLGPFWIERYHYPDRGNKVKSE